MKKLTLLFVLSAILLTNFYKVNCQIDDIYIIPEEKNPGTAFFYSLLVTGMGQMCNDEVGSGFAILGLSVISGYVALTYYDKYDSGSYSRYGSSSSDEDKNIAVLGAVVFAATWLYSIIDAPVTAKSISEEARIKKAVFWLFR